MKNSMKFLMTCVLGISFSGVALAADYKARHISLQTVDDAPNSASGTLTVTAPGDPNQSFVYLQFNVSKLPPVQVNGSDFYTLYLETPSNGKIRLISFNTGGSAWNFSSDHAFGTANLYSWFNEPLTATITHERDDGIDAHVGSGSFVLSGSTD